MTNNQWNNDDQNANEWRTDHQNPKEQEPNQWNSEEPATAEWNSSDWNNAEDSAGSAPNNHEASTVFMSSPSAATAAKSSPTWPWIVLAVVAVIAAIAALSFYFLRDDETNTSNAARPAASESTTATSESATAEATETSENESVSATSESPVSTTVTQTQTVTATQGERIEEGVVVDGRYYYNTPESADRPVFCDGRGVLIISSEYSYEDAEAVAAQNPGSEVLMPGLCASLRQVYNGQYVYPVVIDYRNDIDALCAAEAAGRGNARIMQDVEDWSSPC